jgi:hypothetical protein
MQPPISDPRALLGPGLQPLAKHAVVRPNSLIANVGSIPADPPDRLLLARRGPLQRGYSVPMRGGRHHFFPNWSIGATFRSMASASIRSGLAFSS